ALYRQGYDEAAPGGDHDQAYYLGINTAFMELAYRQDKKAAEAIATKLLDHCANSKNKKWRLATQGEAHLILGDFDIALDDYRQAAAEMPSARERESTFTQALRVADLVGADERVMTRLRNVSDSEG
ncbi:MAG: alpha/beta hydrolase, partial [Nitrospiraceae bacterium]|nr:alpha/beta hydrolase [Nitrospiraceae bacterium]